MATTDEMNSHLVEKYGTVGEDAEPLVKLRAYVMSKGVTGIRGISRIFKRMDSMGDRKLDWQEFWEGIQEYNIPASESDARKAFDAIDGDGSGTISFDEFLVALRPPLSEERLAIINEAFEKFDRTGSGSVTVEDLWGVYSAESHPKFQSGEWTEDEVLQHWIDQFTAEEGDYEITKDDFINYYTGVSSSIDDDQYFVEMMRRAWKM